MNESFAFRKAQRQLKDLLFVIILRHPGRCVFIVFFGHDW
jgi:hypothetical protein